MNCESWGFIRSGTCGTYPQVIRGNLIGILHHYVTCLQDCKGQIKGYFTDYFNYSQNNRTQVAQSGWNLFTHNSVQMHGILLKMNKDYCNFTSWFWLFVHFKSCFIGSLILFIIIIIIIQGGNFYGSETDFKKICSFCWILRKPFRPFLGTQSWDAHRLMQTLRLVYLVTFQCLYERFRFSPNTNLATFSAFVSARTICSNL